jgi:putative transposase
MNTIQFLTSASQNSDSPTGNWGVCDELSEICSKSSGGDSATALRKPRLLSDNSPSYIAGELAEYIEARKMRDIRAAPRHTQTQGKTECRHQMLKNRILLENYFQPGDLEAQIAAFVEH